MTSLLEVSDLSVSFESRAGRRRILNANSLSVAPGDTVGVVGESGSGKTVLVRSILGLLEPQLRIDSGRIVFRGRNLVDLEEPELQQIRGKDIALTTPEPRKHLNPLITIGRQMVNVIRAHQDIDSRQATHRAVELLNAVGIPDPEMRLAGYPHELSGGMCQRVIIAMAL
ncbi:MAG: ATP-binding cassette domain-containing protein, partial [Gammaproteobacteria bacterium]